MKKIIQVYQATCSRCGKSWITKIQKPSRQCPYCHSFLWDKEARQLKKCEMCGRSWHPRIKERSLCKSCFNKTKYRKEHPKEELSPGTRLFRVILGERDDIPYLPEAQVAAFCCETLFPQLTQREQYIIKLRFGFINNQPRTLEATSNEFCVTRERIRQIEAKALRKLRQKDIFTSVCNPHEVK